MEGEEENREEQEVEPRGQRVVIPEDGYEWRKYGQKYIKNIDKLRSYFKCHKENCQAKKKAEWSESSPENVRLVYDGVHNHPPASAQQQSSASSQASANQYNLLNQLLGDQSRPQ